MESLGEENEGGEDELVGDCGRLKGRRRGEELEDGFHIQENQLVGSHIGN